VKLKGKAKALELKTPFFEIDLLKENLDFIFENLNQIKNINVLDQHDQTVKAEGDANARENC